MAETDIISPNLPPSGNPELDANRDRFSGYNLPSKKLDDGFDYYVVGVHPYFINQPTVWQKPAFQIGFNTVGGHVDPFFSSPKKAASPRKMASEAHSASTDIPFLPVQ